MSKPPAGGTTKKHSGGAAHHHHSGAKGQHSPKHHPAHHHHHAKSSPAATKARKPKTPHKPAHPKRGLSLGSVACCAAEALAASLRLTGCLVSDEDVLALYWHTAHDPGAGASILATQKASAEHGLARIRPRWFAPAPVITSGVIIGTTLPGGPHTVTADGGGFWTWGEWHPSGCEYLGEIEEAWTVTW